MNTQLVGLNIGYGWTKAVHDTRSVLFESQIAPAVTVQFHSDLMSNGHDLTVEVDGQAWLVGEWARMHSETLISPRSRERDPMVTRALLVAALHRLGITGGPVRLVTGLPIKWYRRDREIMVKMLSGEQHALVNGARSSYYVEDVLVMPESYGTLYRALLNHDGVLEDKRNIRAEKVAILDIGTYTTNYVLTDATRYIEHGSDSVTTGMANVYDLIQRDCAEMPGGRELSYRDAEMAAQEGLIKVRGQAVEVRAIVEAAKSAIARTVLGMAKTKWQRDDLAVVLVTGGGGEALFPYIEQAYPQARLVTDAQMSNAEGFYRYALLKAQTGASRMHTS